MKNLLPQRGPNRTNSAIISSDQSTASNSVAMTNLLPQRDQPIQRVNDPGGSSCTPEKGVSRLEKLGASWSEKRADSKSREKQADSKSGDEKMSDPEVEQSPRLSPRHSPRHSPRRTPRRVNIGDTKGNFARASTENEVVNDADFEQSPRRANIQDTTKKIVRTSIGIRILYNTIVSALGLAACIFVTMSMLEFIGVAFPHLWIICHLVLYLATVGTGIGAQIGAHFMSNQ